MKPIRFLLTLMKDDILKEQKINVSTAAVPHYATGGQRDDTIEIVLINHLWKQLFFRTDQFGIIKW